MEVLSDTTRNKYLIWQLADAVSKLRVVCDLTECIVSGEQAVRRAGECNGAATEMARGGADRVYSYPSTVSVV